MTKYSYYLLLSCLMFLAGSIFFVFKVDKLQFVLMACLACFSKFRSVLF